MNGESGGNAPKEDGASILTEREEQILVLVARTVEDWVKKQNRREEGSNGMKFMVTFSWKAGIQTQAEGIRRFRKTGGQPPKGVKLLGRWTQVDFKGGFAFLESDDPKALTKFALMWSDLMEVTIVPVLEDQELSEVFQRRGK
jgi:Domain of unknown function (DUF3303)